MAERGDMTVLHEPFYNLKKFGATDAEGRPTRTARFPDFNFAVASPGSAVCVVGWRYLSGVPWAMSGRSDVVLVP